MSEEKRPAGIAVNVKLHMDVKSEAPRRGMNLEQAYDEALREWLGHGSKTCDPLKSLSVADRRIAQAAIEILRQNTYLAEAIRAIVKVQHLK